MPEFTESLAPKMLDTAIQESPKVKESTVTNLPSPKKPTPPPPPPPKMEKTICSFERIVEDMPRFPGCEDLLTRAEKTKCSNERLLSFLKENIKYPAIARETGIEGTVIVSFIVEKDGTVNEIKVVRDIGGACGDEAVRVVKKMPKWRAGRQRGRKVRVQFNLPVRFSLKWFLKKRRAALGLKQKLLHPV